MLSVKTQPMDTPQAPPTSAKASDYDSNGSLDLLVSALSRAVGRKQVNGPEVKDNRI